MYIQKAFKTLLFLLVLTHVLYAQHQEVTEKPNTWRDKNHVQKDTILSLSEAFRKGSAHGHFRYYFMTTDNSDGLSDYYANAIGGGIKYETGVLKGFQFGLSGFFIYNVGSTDLSMKDVTTNASNRYELGLFDITDAQNKNDIDRLEELYLKYKWESNQVTFGKQLINTSFINLQDGRMRPTEVEGIYAEIRSIKDTKIEGGLIYRISPRSTVEWYGIGESIGIYSQGVNIDGTKSDYANHLESNYIGLVNATYNISKKMTLKIDELFVDNIMNSTLVQINFNSKTVSGMPFDLGLQCIRQDAINYGGSDLFSRTYMPKGSLSWTYGAKAGIVISNIKSSINYNRITKHGRYLMPREWGRDPFFTFLPRERNEGLGGVDAWVFKSEYAFPKLNIKTQIGLGYYALPDVTNYTLNKYGMPSYSQLNIDIRYVFQNFLKGMEIQLLYVVKKNNAEPLDDQKYFINKVDMQHWNFLMNYHF